MVETNNSTDFIKILFKKSLTDKLYSHSLISHPTIKGDCDQS